MTPVDFWCDLSQQGTELLHCWEHTVGSCHAPIALRADWQQQLRRCHSELGFRYVRFHGLLSDDVGTVVTHKDQLLYSFFNADQIVDFILSIGMRPFVELSFMPTSLASGSTTVFQYRGNVTRPKDYKQWSTLIHRLVSHWITRYGIQEVAEWFFEVWNEPNLKAFWTGTQEDYFTLYRVTANAIKRVDPSLKVGGPATARDGWIEEFLEFCERGNAPVDFVTTHHYPTDALGHEDDDTETQLANSQRGVLREWAQDTRRRAGQFPVYYTEWNSSSNPRDPRHDEPYAAAFVTKTAVEASDLVQGYSFWTFSDIFEENYFPSVPFHGGFGLLTLQGVAKPTYRAFELLHRLGSERLLVDGLHETVNAWVTRDHARVSALLVNHALPRHSIAPARVRVHLAHAPEPAGAWLERIDTVPWCSQRSKASMGSSAVSIRRFRLMVPECPVGSRKPLRARSGAGHSDDRELPFRVDLAAHAELSICRCRFAPCRVQGRLVDWPGADRSQLRIEKPHRRLVTSSVAPIGCGDADVAANGVTHESSRPLVGVERVHVPYLTQGPPHLLHDLHLFERSVQRIGCGAHGIYHNLPFSVSRTAGFLAGGARRLGRVPCLLAGDARRLRVAAKVLSLLSVCFACLAMMVADLTRFLCLSPELFRLVLGSLAG